jgi:sterol desaturase/sphingolipid hydroxylase (fatty acid hydroxylase superfamily)
MEVSSAGVGRGRRSTVVVTAVLVVVAVVLRPQVAVGLLLLAALFVPLERAWSLHRQAVLRPGWRTDVVHLLVNAVLAGAATAVLAGVPVLVLTRGAGGLLDALVDLRSALPVLVQVTAAVAVIAVTRYWSHRLTHTVPVLWRFHAVHHSSERLDWLASARVHPLDLALANAATLVPLYVLGFRGAGLGAVGVVLAVLPFLDHANVRLRLPGLRWVVPNPEWHHWHHARSPIDKNFSPFPLVDLLFGTAHLPRRWPEGYGTDAPVPPEGYLAQLLHPFRRASQPAPS